MDIWIIILLIIGGTALVSYPLGHYLKWAMDPGEQCSPFRKKLDCLFLKLGGSMTTRQQNWKSYALSLVAFNVVIFLLGSLILALQTHLPLNPDGLGSLDPSLIFNTASSFTTNTNLQHYSGESTLSYFSQLFSLMWLQFVTPAVGLAALTAFARGLSGRNSMGNFFMDMIRGLFLVLVPLSIIFSFALIIGEVPMTLDGAAIAQTLDGGLQSIARGPVSCFLTIKQLGTNGGGFFGTNGTHPLETATFFADCVCMVALIIIPMACVWFYGLMVNRKKHACVIFAVMFAFIAIKAVGAVTFESVPTQAFESLPIDSSVNNLEGKELRLGAVTGPLWSVLTTCTSNGSVGAMHNSINPLSGLVTLVGMWLNSTFGGIGVGMIGMLFYLILAVFLSGLMVGRTPEYLNRKIGAPEIKAVMIAIIAHPALIIGGVALFAATSWGYDTILNDGARGFTEIIYEFTSSAANNGSGYEGLGDNTTPWNIATGLVMLIGRFIPILLALYLGGRMTLQKATAEGEGTLPTDTVTFGVMLFATIVFLGALTFFPLAILGPVLEHLSFM